MGRRPACTSFLRPHSFAHERVGFITVRAAKGHQNLVLCEDNTTPSLMDTTLEDPTVGATTNQEAIRKALENRPPEKPVGTFLTFTCTRYPDGYGSARYDLREQLRDAPDSSRWLDSYPMERFVLSRNLSRGQGAAVSLMRHQYRRIQYGRPAVEDHASERGRKHGLLRMTGDRDLTASAFSVKDQRSDSRRPGAAIVGVAAAVSHIGQQLAHVGVGHYCLNYR